MALTAAIAMVVASLVVRARLDDGGEGGGGELRLVCASEVADACSRLARRTGTRVQVTVEGAGATAERLSKHDPGRAPPLDGWLVPRPWPEMVVDARRRAGLPPLLDQGPVLARSPVVLAAWPERAAVLAQRCAQGRIGWRCLGDFGGVPWASLGGQPTWGRVKPGHADPVQEAAGLTVVGAATVGFFGGADLARVDLEENDAYRAWLTRLESSVPTFTTSAGTPLGDMLLKGPGAFDVVGTTEAEAGPLMAAAARPDKPQLIYPSPVATADVVLATASGERRRVAEVVEGDAGRAALAETGWRVAGRARARGVGDDPALPPSNGLPDAGVLETVRGLVRGIRR